MGLPTQSLPDPEDVTFTFKQTSNAAEDDDQNTLFCKLSVFKKAVTKLAYPPCASELFGLATQCEERAEGKLA